MKKNQNSSTLNYKTKGIKGISRESNRRNHSNAKASKMHLSPILNLTFFTHRIYTNNLTFPSGTQTALDNILYGSFRVSCKTTEPFEVGFNQGINLLVDPDPPDQFNEFNEYQIDWTEEYTAYFQNSKILRVDHRVFNEPGAFVVRGKDIEFQYIDMHFNTTATYTPTGDEDLDDDQEDEDAFSDPTDDTSPGTSVDATESTDPSSASRATLIYYFLIVVITMSLLIGLVLISLHVYLLIRRSAPDPPRSIEPIIAHEPIMLEPTNHWPSSSLTVEDIPAPEEAITTTRDSLYRPQHISNTVSYLDDDLVEIPLDEPDYDYYAAELNAAAVDDYEDYYYMSDYSKSTRSPVTTDTVAKTTDTVVIDVDEVNDGNEDDEVNEVNDVNEDDYYIPENLEDIYNDSVVLPTTVGQSIASRHP